jgi:ubiquinone/menaquinone biosynthesis C-methylase UbiE
MPTDSHAGHTIRQVDPGWMDTMTTIVQASGKRVLDIGCGEGIYAQAWAQLGATVLGLDRSAEALAQAIQRCTGSANVTFRQGDALATGLSANSADIVFERALIHHVDDVRACMAEAYRLLTPGGVYIVQDRTQADVKVAGSPEHLRGYVFERFPRLLRVELPRRPGSDVVQQLLWAVGFGQVHQRTLWETSAVYPTFAQLAEDVQQRQGWWSILQELSDAEVADLIAFIRQRIPTHGSIVNRDRWTIWWAIK